MGKTGAKMVLQFQTGLLVFEWYDSCRTNIHSFMGLLDFLFNLQSF